MAGLTTSGFTAKTLEEVRAELESALLAEFPALNTRAGVINQLLDIFASKTREVWELAEAVYASGGPSSATGDALDRLAELTGTVRRAATRSLVVATVNLDAGVTLPSGSEAHVDGDETARFRTTAAATNGGASAANVSVQMEAVSTGPVAANAGTLIVIATPVAGWNSVTNAEDAVLGADRETDAELRQRRESELRAIGGSTVEAIRSDLLEIATVLEVAVFENTTNAVDGDGVPAHAIEVVVRSEAGASDDTDIAEALWAAKPAGIATHGDESVDIEDSRGVTQAVEFTRATVVDVHLEVDVDVDGDEYPADGDDLIAAAVAELADATLGVGDDVILSRLYGAVFGVAGVLDVTEIRVGTSPSPVSTSNLAIAARSLADIDTSRISVTSTAA